MTPSLSIRSPENTIVLHAYPAGERARLRERERRLRGPDWSQPAPDPTQSA